MANKKVYSKHHTSKVALENHKKQIRARAKREGIKVKFNEIDTRTGTTLYYEFL